VNHKQIHRALLATINLTIRVIGHEGSAVLVILNGLSLLRFRGETNAVRK